MDREEASQAIVEGISASLVAVVVLGLAGFALSSGYQSSAKDSALRDAERTYGVSVPRNELPDEGHTRSMLVRHEGTDLVCTVTRSGGLTFDCGDTTIAE